jgi:hypothetical protein
MSLVTQPFELSARLLQAAIEMPARLQELDERAARMQDQLDRALALGEVIAANTAAMVEMAERVESRGASMIELGERMMALGNSVTEQSESIARALAIATPLEGTVERLGRALDRLPGGKPRPE